LTSNNLHAQTTPSNTHINVPYHCHQTTEVFRQN
jgi:hypothetical protein